MGNVLVTDATGGVERSLARLLPAMGLHVVEVRRRVEALRSLAANLWREAWVALAGDLTNGDLNQGMAEHGSFDVLVHMATATATNCRLRDPYVHNAAATVQLLESIEGCVGHIVFFSSIDVYGMPQNCPIAEAPSGPAGQFLRRQQVSGRRIRPPVCG